MSSILTDMKNALGLASDAEGFDTELCMHINSILSDFTQLGVGPDAGFAIEDESETWEEFLSYEAEYPNVLNSAKSLMFLRLKMLFDPPQVGYVLTSYEKMIEKMEWRLNIAREELVHPYTPPTPKLPLEKGFTANDALQEQILIESGEV